MTEPFLSPEKAGKTAGLQQHAWWSPSEKTQGWTISILIDYLLDNYWQLHMDSDILSRGLTRPPAPLFKIQLASFQIIKRSKLPIRKFLEYIIKKGLSLIPLWQIS